MRAGTNPAGLQLEDPQDPSDPLRQMHTCNCTEKLKNKLQQQYCAAEKARIDTSARLSFLTPARACAHVAGRVDIGSAHALYGTARRRCAGRYGRNGLDCRACAGNELAIRDEGDKHVQALFDYAEPFAQCTNLHL